MVKYPIDLPKAAKLVGHDLKVAEEVHAYLLKNLREEYAAIQAAMIANDSATLKQLIHRFHGALCYSGLTTLKKAVAKVHQALREGKDLAEIAELMQPVDQEIVQLLAKFVQINK